MRRLLMVVQIVQGAGGKEVSHAQAAADALSPGRARSASGAPTGNAYSCPADWIFHAKMILRSWEGARTTAIAAELRCHAQTVRERIQAFNERGLEGLGMRPGGGRKPRVTELERRTILALVKLPPPGKPGYERTGEFEAEDERAEAPAEWTLDTLTAAARARHPGGAQPGAPDLSARRRPLAPHPAVGDQQRSRLRPKRARIVALYTAPPPEATVFCVDELGPVTPRNLPPAPGWSADGHRIKVPLDYERGPDKVWVYGALCVRDGQALTQTAASRNTTGYLALLQTLDHAYPRGDLYLIADNLASHSSGPIRDWLADHPRLQHAFIPIGAAWLNLMEGWWRLFRRKALAGESLANADDIAYVTHVATAQLNRHAGPWVWGRPPRPHRHLRRCFTYRL